MGLFAEFGVLPNCRGSEQEPAEIFRTGFEISGNPPRVQGNADCLAAATGYPIRHANCRNVSEQPEDRIGPGNIGAGIVGKVA